MCSISAVLYEFPAVRKALLKRIRIVAPLLLLLALPAAGLHASTFIVTAFTDANAGSGGSGPGNFGDLRWTINQANSAGGTNTIEFSCPSAPCTITLNGPLPPIVTSMTIDGGSFGDVIIDGNNLYRVFFVDTGTVTIANLQIQNAYAAGGNGGDGGTPGGGGAGFGAGLFVNQSTAAVTVQNDYFYNCNVTGGNGGAATAADLSGGGGGGLGGNGGNGSASGTTGGGGGGVIYFGQTGDAGGAGAAGGGGGAGSSSTPGAGGSSYATASGGSSGAGDTGGAGGFGGGGGGGDSAGAGGAGGVGAGGGGPGTSYSGSGGQGGFGGGGSGGPPNGAGGQSGTYVFGQTGGTGGAGSASGSGGGGGGAAEGPAIFVNQGTLTVQNTTASSTSTTVGVGGLGSNGGSTGNPGLAPGGISSYLLTNYPDPNPNSGAAFQSSMAWGIGFTMNETANLTSVKIRFATVVSSPPTADLTVAIYGDNAGSPGTSLQTLTIQNGESLPSNGTADLTFKPSSTLTLTSGTTYWVFIQWANATSIYVISDTTRNDAYTMSGATYLGVQFANPFPNWGPYSFLPDMDVQVSTDPAIFNYAGKVDGGPTPGAYLLPSGLPATHFSVSAPSSFQGRTSQTVTVAALDVNGNAATGYSGTVNLTSTNAGASFTSNPITLSGGTGSTTFSMSTPGSGFTITATDANEPSITGTSGGIDVTVGAFSKLAVSAPSAATAGTSFPFTVTAEDSDGNTITTFADTIAFSSGDGAAVLPANSTLVNGTGTFSATLNTAGSQTLTATDSAKSISGQAAITVTVPTWLVVNTTADDAGTAGNCHAQSGPNSNTTDISPRCSLRDALLNAAGQTLSNISFDSGVFASANTAAANTITMVGVTMTIPSNTQITGPLSGTGVTVDGAQSFAIFATASNSVGVGISGLTIADGLTTSASHSDGGAGIQNNGALTLTDCTFYNNQALNGYGGAIQLTNASTLSMTGSTFNGNLAIQGGAIYDGGATSIAVSQSTFYNNTVGTTGEGGAVFINNASTTVAGSTFAANSALNGGAIYTHGSGTLSLHNNIFTANSASSVGGAVENGETASLATANYNLFNNNTAGSSGPDCDNCGSNTNEVTGTPNLTAFGSYGGPTQTMLPLPGSAAICAASASLIPSGELTDQRGTGFPITNATYPGYSAAAPCVDLGAVQTNYAIAFTTQPPALAAIGVPLSPAPVVGLTESGTVIAAATNAIAMTDTGSALGGTTTANLSSGAAAFNNLTLGSSVSNDTLTATMALTSTLNLTASGSTQISTVVPVTPTFTWTPATTIISGDAGTSVLNASMSCGACGTIAYTATPSGESIAGTSTLAPGVYTITATFSPGSAAYNATSTTAQLTVSGESLWIVDGAGATSELAGNGAALGSSAYSGANTAAAIDATGNVWTVGSGPTLIEINQVGTTKNTIASGGGLASPAAIAIDGNSRLWIVNGADNTVSLFSDAGAPLSPSTGFTDSSLSTPSSIAVDLGGSVWIANKGNNSVTRILGAATPAAPLSTAIQNNTTGATP